MLNTHHDAQGNCQCRGGRVIFGSRGRWK